jgi:hypothetical protein
MAFQVRLKNRNLVSLSVSQSVGRSKTGRLAANLFEDVMLTQWLLAKNLDKKFFLGPPVVVNGEYGPQTDYLLCRFFSNLSEWLFRHQGKFGMSTTLDVETDTIIQPMFHKGNVNDLMQRFGEISEFDLPQQLKSMPLRLRQQLEKNVESWPK